jgi:hypothetical protein
MMYTSLWSVTILKVTCWSVPSFDLTERVRSISIMRSPTIVLIASIFSVHSAGVMSASISSQMTTVPFAGPLLPLACERAVLPELLVHQPSGRMSRSRKARTDLPLPRSDAITRTNVFLKYISKHVRYISSCNQSARSQALACVLKRGVCRSPSSDSVSSLRGVVSVVSSRP